MRTAADYTATAYAPIASRYAAMKIISPDTTLSDIPEKPQIGQKRAQLLLLLPPHPHPPRVVLNP